MQLQPRRQPGRIDRKAAAYASEILRLRAEGYTYEAIQEALADAGVDLSTSTLRREVRRHRRSSPSLRLAWPAPTSTIRPSPQTVRPPSPSGITGREIAEAFFDANPSNPLLRLQETP